MNLKKYIIPAILLLSLILNAWLFNTNQNQHEQSEIDKRNNTALLSQLDSTIEKGIKKYYRLTPEGNIKDILNSEVFEHLSKQDQEFYTTLKKQKDVIASSQAIIALQAAFIKEYTLTHQATVNNDSISFKTGTALTFEDTSTNLVWKSTIRIENPLGFKLDYVYNATINSTFKRNPDKSIQVEYTLNDPNARILNINSFIIPQENKSKFQTWKDKHRKPFNISVGAILLGTGIYVGSKIQ